MTMTHEQLTAPTTKSIEWVKPETLAATHCGFPHGCWVVAVYGYLLGRTTLAAFADLHEAQDYAEKLAQPYGRNSH
jgi:hypothetical protein